MTDDLARDADWNAEAATHAYLDGYYREALEPADRAVKFTRRFLRRTPDDQRVIYVFADRYSWRALIHEKLGNQTKAINDAQAAITLLRRLEDSPSLRIATLRLLQCELYGVLGEAAAAREAGQAVEAYRQWAREDDADPLAIAEALSRYAAGMALIGDAEAAIPARREAVDAYRAGLHSTSGDHDRLRFARSPGRSTYEHLRRRRPRRPRPVGPQPGRHQPPHSAATA